MLIDLSLATLFALQPLLDQAQCDQLVAQGLLAQAVTACAAAPHGGTPAGLDLARVAATKPTKGPGAALVAAEQARASNPHRIIEEALCQHLERQARASLAPTAQPASARWPLAGLPLPTPTLSPLNDPAVKQVTESLERSRLRAIALRQRLADGDGPASLRKVLPRMEREQALLKRSRLAALEDAISKDPKLPPGWWLHLAGAYFVVDASKADTTAQHARGLSVLNKLRSRFPNTPEARRAGLWLATLAVRDGNAKVASPLIAAGRAADPKLATLLDGLLAWQAGRFEQLDAALLALRGTKRLALWVVPLQAEAAWAAGKDLEAAKFWEQLQQMPIDPDLRSRAHLRRGIAWADAVVSGTPAARVPVRLQPMVTLSLLRRGGLDLASQVLDEHLSEAEPTLELAALELQLIAAFRTVGDHTAADRRLGRAAKRFGPKSPWSKAVGAAALAVHQQLRAQLDVRLAPYLTAGRTLTDAERTRIGPVLDARLNVIPLPKERWTHIAGQLRAAGFLSRADVVLSRVSQSAPDAKTRAVADTARLEIALRLARQRGAAGAPVGAFLNGTAPTKEPAPETRKVLDALTRLIERLPPEDPVGDGYLLNRAAIRAEGGELDAVFSDLEGVASRNPGTMIQLQATHLLLGAIPKHRARLAQRAAHKKVGPVERDTQLRALIKLAYADRAGDQALALVSRRLFSKALPIFQQQVAAAPPALKSKLMLAYAACATLALDPSAVAAWQALITTKTEAPERLVAIHHLADLLEAQGQRSRAAATLMTLADHATAKDIERLLRLRPYHRETQQIWAPKLLKLAPEDANARRLVKQLAPEPATKTERVRSHPSAPVCRAKACAGDGFWPTLTSKDAPDPAETTQPAHP